MASAAPADPPATGSATASPAAGSAAVHTLSDGTRVSHWTTANGLRVVTRHVPGARSAAITLSYRLGSRDDPKQHEGLADLVAQAAFTGRCGDVPMRSVSELDQLRPGGWSIKLGPYLTELTEACPKDLLPGVLHQVCQRFKGVAVGDTMLRRARTEVLRRLRANYDTRPENTLYFLSGEMIAGGSADRAARYAMGQGLDNVTAREVAAQLHERLVPSNSVLCIVGDLDALNVRAVIERELADVAAGSPAPEIAWGHIVPAVGNLARPDLSKPIGVLGIFSPALSDTMHAYFTAFTLSAAASLIKQWGKPDPPLVNRFQYSLSTDPEIVRFYPPVTETVMPDRSFESMIDKASETIADSSSIGVAAQSMIWLTGGPLPADLLKRSLSDATVIHTIATTLAGLESFGDDAFWTAYRARLEHAHDLNLAPFFKLYDDPRRRVMLVLRPARKH